MTVLLNERLRDSFKKNYYKGTAPLAGSSQDIQDWLDDHEEDIRSLADDVAQKNNISMEELTNRVLTPVKPKEGTMIKFN